MQYVQDHDEVYAPRYIDYDTTGADRRKWPELLYPYIKQKGGAGMKNADGSRAKTDGVFLCPSSPVTDATLPHYGMSCDYNWGWKGFVWHGQDSSLREADVIAPADTLFITETPKCDGDTAFCRDAQSRVCQPKGLDAYHYDSITWNFHTDISTNRSFLRHNSGLNYIFFDGHVKWMRAEATVKPRNLWTMKDND